MHLEYLIYPVTQNPSTGFHQPKAPSLLGCTPALQLPSIISNTPLRNTQARQLNNTQSQGIDEIDLTKWTSIGGVGVANSVGKCNDSKTSLPPAMN